MGDEEQYYKRLSNGEYFFNSEGKPMLVKRTNVGNLPSILAQPGVGVDGVIIKHASQADPETANLSDN